MREASLFLFPFPIPFSPVRYSSSAWNIRIIGKEEKYVNPLLHLTPLMYVEDYFIVAGTTQELGTRNQEPPSFVPPWRDFGGHVNQELS